MAEEQELITLGYAYSKLNSVDIFLICFVGFCISVFLRFFVVGPMDIGQLILLTGILLVIFAPLYLILIKRPALIEEQKKKKESQYKKKN